MGHGVDLVAGRYSQGAAGFAIRGGELAEPVSEITIAGDLREMLLGLDAADDLVFRGAVNAPTPAPGRHDGRRAVTRGRPGQLSSWGTQGMRPNSIPSSVRAFASFGVVSP